MEFLLLLVTTFLVSLAVTLLVVWFFRNPIDKLLYRVIGDEIARTWRKFLTFAMLVVGVSSGVAIWRMERYIEPDRESGQVLALTRELWGLEIYRAVIQSLGGLAWALLVFFLVALVAFVVVKRGETRSGQKPASGA